jgi:2-polyprenyl-6-methoxyphenol hydroxylase-like FAD-dependent oxidoreductase
MLRVGWYPTGKLTIYPCRPTDQDGNQLMNWIAAVETPRYLDRDWGREGRLEDFIDIFADWHFDFLDVPAVFEAADAILEYPMVDQDPLDQWTFGRVTLLGDAAHPMYPIGSNGASQAILDARVLARDIRAFGATEAALRCYEAERRPTTAAIVLANRKNGPEQVMQAVEERAPGGFARIEDVLSAQELQETAAGYKRIAGFDKEVLNNRAPIVPT